MIATGPSFVVDSNTVLARGTYHIEGETMGLDPELPPGVVEIYEHPIRGLSYWDDWADDGTDFAGHVSAFYLIGATLTPVST